MGVELEPMEEGLGKYLEGAPDLPTTEIPCVIGEFSTVGKKGQPRDPQKLVYCKSDPKGGAEMYSKILSILRRVSGKARRGSPLEELKMDYNHKQKIEKILDRLSGFGTTLCSDESAIRDLRVKMRSLLVDFCDALATSSRAEGMYAFVVGLPPHDLLIIHCHLSETIGRLETYGELRLVERLLDDQNILRVIRCRPGRRGIEVRYWEKSRSQGFADFLGVLPETIEFEEGEVEIAFTHPEWGSELLIRFPNKASFYRDVFINKRFHFDEEKGNILITPTNEAIRFRYIKFNDKKYEVFGEEFKSAFITDLFSLDKFRKIFKEELYGNVLARSSQRTSPVAVDGIDLLEINLPDIEEKKIDKRPRIEAVEYQYLVVFVFHEKGGGISIEPNEELLEYLHSHLNPDRMDKISVFHAACPFRFEPLQVGSLLIHNTVGLKSEGSLRLVGSLLRHRDPLLQAAALLYLKEMIDCNRDSVCRQGIESLLSDLARYILENKVKESAIRELIIHKEESEFLEYKAGKVITARSIEEMSSQILEIIVKKYQPMFPKVLLIGVDEREKILDPIPSSYLHSDDVTRLESMLNLGVSSESLPAKVKVLRVPTEEGFVLAIILIPSGED